MTITMLAALGTLFLAAFGAATVLPFQSEVVFAAMAVEEVAPLWLLVTVASVGNTLGSVVNYAMGLFIEHWKASRWFPVTEKQLARAQDWYARWGVWTLLLSWAPFGDGFTVVAGIMRTNFWLFLGLVAIAKTGRFLLLAWALA
ncbi:DedA family protein [Limibaculum sp. M0105]|uniref:DedA family protein n=1 Tax=Thermohalobaculum xanthum TaxID=2753746 RepID=A0A8J7SBT5_9RHOB|nr:YqaA family protein [Thermohalobaculum xanthum]MBK0397876.1 DedA family protein [Thermohalobaculum xanthum]